MWYHAFMTLPCAAFIKVLDEFDLFCSNHLFNFNLPLALLSPVQVSVSVFHNFIDLGIKLKPAVQSIRVTVINLFDPSTNIPIYKLLPLKP